MIAYKASKKDVTSVLFTIAKKEIGICFAKAEMKRSSKEESIQVKRAVKTARAQDLSSKKCLFCLYKKTVVRQ